MDAKTLEWLKQADYDMDTAEFMAAGGRCFYAVFMCHLAIEKALKGLYQQRRQQPPPRTHNLVYLMNEVGLKPNEHQARAVATLNGANIATRYPEDIETLRSNYTEAVTARLLGQAKELLAWIKTQF